MPIERGLTNPFQDEQRELQVAIISPIAGRLNIKPDGVGERTLGLTAFRSWAADDVACFIDTPDFESRSNVADQVRLIMMSGQRMFEVAEVRSGPLSGWHDRSRAWSADAGPEGMATVLGVGICDLTEVLFGPSHTFSELIQLAPGGTHVIRALDEPLVPCARVLKEQLQRTPEEAMEIARDMTRTLAGEECPPSPSDLLFIGSLLAGLQRRVLTDSYPILTRGGLSQSKPPDAILMSLGAEGRRVFRHRRLGYTINIHGYRMREAGPWLVRWMRNNFELIQRTTAGIQEDIEAFLDVLNPEISVLILNLIADSSGEDIQNYHGFEEPLSSTVASVRDKEMNLMLHDLACERGVGLIDVATIASGLGQRLHAADQLHHGAIIQAEIREEMATILTARNVRGFRPSDLK